MLPVAPLPTDLPQICFLVASPLYGYFSHSLAEHFMLSFASLSAAKAVTAFPLATSNATDAASPLTTSPGTVPAGPSQLNIIV